MLEIWLPKRLTEEAMQKSNHRDTKLHLLECKITSIMVQSYTHHDAKLQKSGCNSKYPYPLESSTLKLHKYTLKLYNYAVMDSFYHPQMLIYRL